MHDGLHHHRRRATPCRRLALAAGGRRSCRPARLGGREGHGRGVEARAACRSAALGAKAVGKAGQRRRLARRCCGAAGLGRRLRWLLSWRRLAQVVVGRRCLRLRQPARRSGADTARCRSCTVSCAAAATFSEATSLPGGCGHGAQLGRWGPLARGPRVRVGWCGHKHRALQEYWRCRGNDCKAWC